VDAVLGVGDPRGVPALSCILLILGVLLFGPKNGRAKEELGRPRPRPVTNDLGRPLIDGVPPPEDRFCGAGGWTDGNRPLDPARKWGGRVPVKPGKGPLPDGVAEVESESRVEVEEDGRTSLRLGVEVEMLSGLGVELIVAAVDIASPSLGVIRAAGGSGTPRRARCASEIGPVGVGLTVKGKILSVMNSSIEILVGALGRPMPAGSDNLRIRGAFSLVSWRSC
jgi:hypothetical protein